MAATSTGAITVEMCVGGRDVSEPRLARDGAFVVYAVSEEGVANLVARSLDGVSDSQTPDRTLAIEPRLRAARGFGGGAWCFTADESAVVYVGAQGDLWLQPIDGGESRRLTEFGNECSVSSPCCAPDGSSLVFVVDDAEVHQLSFNEGTVHRIDDGSADFCFDPFVEPDSAATRWQAWNVPDMPWDHSRIQRHADNGAVSDLPGSACIQQPRVMPDGRAICIRDDDGWLNVWIENCPLVSEPFEHAGPTWGPGQRSYAWSPDGSRVAFTRNVEGCGRLCVIDVGSSTAPIEVAHGVHGQLSWAGDRVACLRSDACTPPSVVVYDTAMWQPVVVAVAGSSSWHTANLIEPELVEIQSRADRIFARLYRASGSHRGLIVWLHGGPTDQWQVSFMPRIAYWSAQGWNILVPDHRGSTGHGRSYQQALRGQWGILDVHDTIAASAHAHAAGWGTPNNTVVMGGSSGGFTALEVVASDSSLYCAAVVLYPVTDLIDLAQRSHRFERHYTDTLVGALPAATDRYRERSPIEHASRCATTPLLILHGDADPVVPLDHSTVFAERVRAAGGEVELHIYEGEGHGFRQRANQLDEYRRIADFLARYVPLAFGQ